MDVGCGVGTWSKAALECGIESIFGADGVNISAEPRLIRPITFRVVDLTVPWSLERKFETALCLEAAEHLEETASSLLIKCLTAYADTIVFSEACPGQNGQHHVNCQWPEYWQTLLNDEGFGALRGPTKAGTEDRIESVIHPDFLNGIVADSKAIEEAKNGYMPLRCISQHQPSALVAKIQRRCHWRNHRFDMEG